jgi:hypothetical protein
MTDLGSSPIPATKRKPIRNDWLFSFYAIVNPLKIKGLCEKNHLHFELDSPV